MLIIMQNNICNETSKEENICLQSSHESLAETRNKFTQRQGRNSNHCTGQNQVKKTFAGWGNKRKHIWMCLRLLAEPPLVSVLNYFWVQNIVPEYGVVIKLLSNHTIIISEGKVTAQQRLTYPSFIQIYNRLLNLLTPCMLMCFLMNNPENNYI